MLLLKKQGVLAENILPVPKVLLQKDNVTSPNYQLVEWYSYGNNAVGGTYKLYNRPEVVAMDLSDELIEKGVYIEMLTYHRGRAKHPNRRTHHAGYKVTPNWDGTTNTFNNLPTRGGDQKFNAGLFGLAVQRPNHFKVNFKNERVPVWKYLHNRMTKVLIKYTDATLLNANTRLSLTVHQGINSAGRNKPSSRFGYSPRFRPLYFVFRYIIKTDDGNFVSGPISPTIKLSEKVFPFVFDKLASNYLASTALTINPLADSDEAQCWFETRLP